MISSMTGFAGGQGQFGSYRWTWELRSVNGKGQDLRLRVPDWLPGLEQALRAELASRVARGSVTLTVRVQRDEAEAAMRLDTAHLDMVLIALAEVEARALERGLSLAPGNPAAILAMRGVLGATGDDDAEIAELVKAMVAAFPALVDELLQMRRREGAALRDILSRNLDEIAALVARARALTETRSADLAAAFRAALDRVVDSGASVEAARIAQELALLAVKADIAEELDRLDAHVAAARELIDSPDPVGRKLDFLMQEFNREANTLCSKSQHAEMTAIGLELKVAIDQMREQVQNVE